MSDERDPGDEFVTKNELFELMSIVASAITSNTVAVGAAASGHIEAAFEAASDVEAQLNGLVLALKKISRYDERHPE